MRVSRYIVIAAVRAVMRTLTLPSPGGRGFWILRRRRPLNRGQLLTTGIFQHIKPPRQRAPQQVGAEIVVVVAQNAAELPQLVELDGGIFWACKSGSVPDFPIFSFLRTGGRRYYRLSCRANLVRCRGAGTSDR